MTLEGRVAVVTGASKGMGSHFVDALVAAGARVACLARASVELDAVVARHGGMAAGFACDVGNAGAVDAAIAAAADRFGRIDLLVNNAAIFHPFLVEDATVHQVEQHVAVNLMGPIWCIRAAIPHLRKSQGQIVTISSESVRMPFPYLTVYAATKAAVEALSQGLRDELRSDGIRVSVLRSGSVAGGTGGQHWDGEVAQRFFAKIQETGHASFTGDFAEPTTMALTLVAMVSLPPDVNLDLVEARSAKPATPDSLSRSGANRH
ncbi:MULTISPECIES: SDR family oxidoreductase [Sphingobium]|jgi:meso-butanediol dehydrogenase / (S,S)-butanediol dehydrogenase / diacetyl reductase|uniref:SDR family oxidoreductase n=1 Tax=Sphingobium TaxID=165695 RepID=UPI0009FD67F9|nr:MULTISPECIES: SDR family oxidoreductase [Sphingobium]MBS48890.1 NAD(P)-dependent oxidoreductase [Sphingobium sp.]MCC4256213.1 SDR family oxidoreductase [Sphingobium lactosutens]HCW62085.1 SDR family NAD(P)-dependent oxidoreductase [Sphingobium sp.]